MVDLMKAPPTTRITIIGTMSQRKDESGKPLNRVCSPYSTSPQLCKKVGRTARPR